MKYAHRSQTQTAQLIAGAYGHRGRARLQAVIDHRRADRAPQPRGHPLGAEGQGERIGSAGTRDQQVPVSLGQRGRDGLHHGETRRA